MIRRRKGAWRPAVALAAVPAVLSTASAAYQRLAERRDARRFPPPGELVDIGGRRLHVFRSGSSAPAVIVLPAMGTPAIEWIRVHRAVAERTDAQVVLVDRAGIGWSEADHGPRSISTMADEVHTLLTALELHDPVILVGHSVGGLIARLFAARHPQRVARVILVDSSHEDMYERLHRVDRTVRASELWKDAIRWQLRVLGWRRLRFALGGLRELRKAAAREAPADLVNAHLARQLTGNYRRAAVQEFLGLLCGRQALRREARELGDVPITVVTAGPAGRETWYPAWLDLQSDFLTMSNNHSQTFAHHAGHHINRDDPDFLAAVILDAVRAAETR